MLKRDQVLGGDLNACKCPCAAEQAADTESKRKEKRCAPAVYSIYDEAVTVQAK